jgi:Homeodomain-like domain
MRRWRERYEEFGYDGLFDRRHGKPSPKRVPWATAERVLQLYREKYSDFNVRHFHEKLREEHQIRLSYTWVKKALQGAGLVRGGRKRGVHRRRRERRPLPGMLLHLDGSRHRWFQDDRWYDLLVILDDATSEIYYAQLVDEESTVTVMAALREVIEHQGVFCALYSDRASHFFETPKAGGPVDAERVTQVGRAALGETGLGFCFLAAAGACGRPGQHGAGRQRRVADGEDALARDLGGLPGDRPRAWGRNLERRLRPARGGMFQSGRNAAGSAAAEQAAGKGCGKEGRETPLERFPLSHSLGGGEGLLTSTGQIMC